jgi:hypothetical protein
LNFQHRLARCGYHATYKFLHFKARAQGKITFEYPSTDARTALWLAFNMHGMIQRMGSALVMGVAVCGMHYTAMQGASFSVLDAVPNLTPPGLGGEFLGTSIFLLSTLIMGVVLVVSVIRENQRESVRI